MLKFSIKRIGSLFHHTKFIVLLVILSAGLAIPYTSKSQSREYLLKAGYVEKFTHFIEWPDLQNSNDSVFNITVIGEGELGKALKEMFSTVQVKNRPVELTYITSIEEINDCNILVISESSNIKLDEVLNYTTDKQILTISDNNGYGKKGVIINMLVIDNYVRYEINRSSLGKSGLIMSSMLLNSAIIVKTDE